MTAPASLSETDPHVAAARERVGSRLNAKWEIEALLGVGGMATVFAGRHRNGSRAALKVLHAELSRETTVRDRFLREGRIVNQIDHPAKVAVSDDDVSDDGEAFLVLELLEGETLDAVLKRAGGKLPIERTMPIFDTVLDLLAHCHDARIVHRDIKPANLFLTTQGHIKVLDFGVARLREGNDQEKTRQGTAIGTPSYMAPEQALGLGDLVDGRADLWSVGACLYTCLTGQRLHAARTEAEAFVLAATKPAPSIARIAPDLPVEVVAFVDKALAYDRAHRFQDARTMRAELGALVTAMRAGQLQGPQSKRETGLVVKANEIVEDDQLDALNNAVAKNQAVDRLKSIWKLLAMFMAGVRQYGWNHPEPLKHLAQAHEEMASALALNPDAIRWDVTPYAFSYEGTPIWEPDRQPFDRLPFQLFGDGLRKVRFRQGVTEAELRDFVAILLRDSKGEDDAVTAIWDRRFDHVAYVAVDSFAEGDADERDAFEGQCDEIVRAAIAASRIDKDWHGGDLESEAMQRNLATVIEEAAAAAAALAIDPATRGVLATQLAIASDKWTERFVDALALALLDAGRQGDVSLLASALREWTRDQLQLRQLGLAFGMLAALARALAARVGPERADAAERGVVDMMFGAEAIRGVLGQIAEDARQIEGRARQAVAVEPAVVSGVARVLELMGDDSLVAFACDCLEKARLPELRPVLMGYVRRWSAGHEAEIGERLGRAPQALALDLVAILSELHTPESMAALGQALHNPIAEVRLATLKAIPGPTAEGLEGDVQALLDDRTTEVRLEAYLTMGRLRMKSAGPGLVRRIQAEPFHHAPIEERKAAFAALVQLNPARAEALAIEILGGSKFIPSPDLEKSRVLAAELLGESRSDDALEALQGATKKRWWNTPPLREAAQKALAQVEARRAGRAVDAPAPSHRPTGAS